MQAIPRMFRSFSATGLLVVVVVVVILITSAGYAYADAKDDAIVAYDRGAAAYDRGDFALATTELAHADELAQSAVTLELALNAAIRADNAVVGMALVDRAEKRRGTSTGSAKVDYAADNARRKLGTKVGRLSVVCPAPLSSTSPPNCVVSVDGTSFEAGLGPRYMAVGAHRVTVTRGPAPETFDVTIEPGKTVELIPTLASSSLPPPPLPNDKTKKTKRRGDDEEGEKSAGLSPAWFWITGGGTLVVGGITIASGLDTIAKHNAFVLDRSNADAASAGQSADHRTVILMASTGALAVLTTVVGLFFVQWSGGSSRSTSALR